MTVIFRDVVQSDAPALAHILITANELAFRGLIPDSCLEFSEDESRANWERFLSLGLPDRDVMLMVEDEDSHIIGYGWGGINTKDNIFQAELRQLMLLPEYQKRGIGRQLVTTIARHMYSQGLTSMRVEVLRVNPNRPFYEHLGAAYQSDQPYDWDSVTLAMCVYGWRDIRLLLANELD
jgi:GNAT superfamily N-acetyltransferase